MEDDVASVLVVDDDVDVLSALRRS